MKLNTLEMEFEKRLTEKQLSLNYTKRLLTNLSPTLPNSIHSIQSDWTYNRDRVSQYLDGILSPIKSLSVEMINDLDSSNCPYDRLKVYYGRYIFLNFLNLDMSGFKYWDFKNTDEVNITRLGFSNRLLIKTLFQKITEKLNISNITKILSMKNLSNLLDFDKVVNNICNGVYRPLNPLSSFFSYDSYASGRANIFTKINQPNENTYDLLERISPFFDILTYSVKTNPYPMFSGNVFSFIFQLWLGNFNSWRSRVGIINKGERRILVENLSLVLEYAKMVNIIHSKIHDKGYNQVEMSKLNKCIPNNLKVHPSSFFSERLGFLNGDKNYEYGLDEVSEIMLNKMDFLECVTFPELPEPFKKLGDQWRHLFSTDEMKIEGHQMGHCVGGDEHLEYASDGDLYFHYDDGYSERGYTVNIMVNFLTDLTAEFEKKYKDHKDWPLKKNQFISSRTDSPWRPHVCSYVVDDIYGYQNQEASITLRTCIEEEIEALWD